MKFKPEDFGDYRELTPHGAAYFANRRLAEMLAEPKNVDVSGSRVDGEWIMTEMICGKPKPGDSHSAKLTCIEEIKPAVCEHVPYRYPDRDAIKLECVKCGAKLRARWELAE